MYLPTHFVQTDVALMHAFMRDIGFASLIQVSSEADVLVNPLPFLLVGEGDNAMLQTHVARGNPLWQRAHGTNATVVFQGPHAYISPRAYQEKPISGKVVPTWNYAVVHAQGVMRIEYSQAWLLDFLEPLSQRHEAQFGADAWSVHDAPADYISNLSKAIVGIEIPIARLQGKWKLSQNRSECDRAAIVRTLKAARAVPPWQYQNELAIAALMS